MAFVKATNLLHWSNDQQSGYMLHHCFIYCRPGGRRGNTKRLFAQWRRPVASGEALVMLHWAMTCSKVGVGGPALFFCQIRKFQAGVSALSSKKKVYQLKKQNFNQNQPESQCFPPCQNWAPTVPWLRLHFLRRDINNEMLASAHYLPPW